MFQERKDCSKMYVETPHQVHYVHVVWRNNQTSANCAVANVAPRKILKLSFNPFQANICVSTNYIALTLAKQKRARFGAFSNLTLKKGEKENEKS